MSRESGAIQYYIEDLYIVLSILWRTTLHTLGRGLEHNVIVVVNPSRIVV